MNSNDQQDDGDVIFFDFDESNVREHLKHKGYEQRK